MGQNQLLSSSKQEQAEPAFCSSSGELAAGSSKDESLTGAATGSPAQVVSAAGHAVAAEFNGENPVLGDRTGIIVFPHAPGKSKDHLPAGSTQGP